ncbi:hypothetical protein BBBOND_0312160 [Babesia bigemina]|uniref:Uncharacterized protein n=1 Tax=Babesia bigemina TaxID=5866 RepID=A0A061D9Y5_BABBI|nr:hypothetical protein BBBOND_0312160 [Babesia bigemina]CDR97313.1 hypothetical protein BBBOND_0312160 [Babesia bigemina]|eukprot:XP_012769499.1 hypothetical protein BBBOND_0312160 [Babesia bigemina]
MWLAILGTTGTWLMLKLVGAQLPWLRLRGLGAAVVPVVVEGTGSGSGSVAVGEWEGKGKMSYYWPGKPCTQCHNNCKRSVVCNCCRWCCEECKAGRCNDCWYDFNFKRKYSSHCHPDGCGKKKKDCTNPKCDCTCCKEKRSREPAASESLSSPDALSQTASEPHLSDIRTEESSSGDSNAEGSTPSPPPYSAIAAVIVSIIVAIILLDLCIFRFPVGRNIRDFLVRKIPVCIAFYN